MKIQQQQQAQELSRFSKSKVCTGLGAAVLRFEQLQQQQPNLNAVQH